MNARPPSLLARLRTRHWLRSCREVGPGAILHGAPFVAGGARLRIGPRFYFASTPSQSHLIAGPDGHIEIGADVAIAHGAAIAAFSGIRIGDGTRIGPYVVIIDTDFHAVGDRDAPAMSEPIALGRGVRIGSHVTIVRGSEIGDGAIVTAGAVVSGKVAPGTRVSGVPARAAFTGSRLDSNGSPLDLGQAVSDVVKQTFGLTAPPDETHGPPQIVSWDSLGALRLLLALEEVFGVPLSEDGVAHAATVGSLTEAVERALALKATAQT